MTLVVGALLQDNRYQIQAVLEETDVEIVYRAVHTYLDKSVLLRQLRGDVEWGEGERPDSRAIMVRLLRFSQCQHPCLGEILDCFEEDGRVYMVLPTYGKLTMAHWLQTNGGVDTAELIDHLRSQDVIFDKFHQNGLVYGLLTPESLHYRAETNELVVAAFSWRMFLADLLGDRHRLSESTAIDIQGLAHIAYRLLTGDVESMGHPGNSVADTDAIAERDIE